MKPVLILQHLSADGPAYLGTWLAGQGVTVDVRNTEAGDPYPDTLDGYRALAILGGEMSANDPLPSLRQAEHLFLQAVRDGIPTLGHCLGGQLMARALGARVTVAPVPEVGWHTLEVVDHPLARAWFGAPGPQTVFQWHYDTFALPPGAVHLAASATCARQAFAQGPHLGMQFHVEQDLPKMERWMADRAADLDAASGPPPTEQDDATMRAGAQVHLAAQQRLAARIYAHWLGQAAAA